MVSSNFERLLFDLYDRDGAAIRRLMDEFKSGAMTLDESALSKARELFSSYKLDDKETLATINELFETCEYLVDPHTAIGIRAARATRRRQDIPMICLATAHPAKFPEAVRQAGQETDPQLPHHMNDLFEREERFEVLPHDLKAVQAFIAQRIRA